MTQTPLVAALLGGQARSVLFSSRFNFVTTESATWEVKKYISPLSARSGVSERELFYALDRFPITTIPSNLFDDTLDDAKRLIAHRDPKDVQVLALALKFGTAIWTNDTDFDNLHGVRVFKTAEMLEKLAELEE
ncbi:MAG: hypothetical protein HY961_12520 [Ignavibacteriae bacterium]|nr:hypothetical protein [Ignavibacteriota bacterium]